MKEYENDLRYLKEQFSDDGLTVPESLSEEAVFAMLEDVPQDTGVTVLEPTASAEQGASSEQRTTIHRTKRFPRRAGRAGSHRNPDRRRTACSAGRRRTG